MDYGLKGDGIQDDGPALHRVLEASREIDAPITISFPAKSTIRVDSGKNRYVFWLTRDQALTIDGNGSTFILDPHLRFLNAFDCEGLTVRELEVDFTTAPTTPGTVLSVSPERQSIIVEVDDSSYVEELGGPTNEDGEQDFFGKILLDANYGMTYLEHYYADRVEWLDEKTVEVFNDRTDFHRLEGKVDPGETRVGLPVAGVAHRHGPGALFVVNLNRDVLLEDIEIRGAPWFAFQIFRNEGTAVFRNVDVRPREDSGNVLASCRDAFHVKGNRGSLLFENCELRGLGDDAFNISTHTSKILSVTNKRRFRMVQKFPLQYFQPRVGDTLVFLDAKTNRRIGERKVASFQESPRNEPSSFETRFVGWSPIVDIVLDVPMEALDEDWIVWIEDSANPDTTIRNCKIYRSCRLMSSVTIEDSYIEAFTWFYGDHKEGPVPERIMVRDCVLRSNTGDRKMRLAFSISGWSDREKDATFESIPENFPTRLVEFTDNEIWGRVLIRDVFELKLERNTFYTDSTDPLHIENCFRVTDRRSRFKHLQDQ